MDPDQTAPIGSELFVIEVFEHFSMQENQTTFVAIGALWVKFLRTGWKQKGTHTNLLLQLYPAASVLTSLGNLALPPLPKSPVLELRHHDASEAPMQKYRNFLQ